MTTALHCLRAGHAEPGRSVLTNGASGGVGTFAVQLAQWMGLNVTAVCSSRNVDLVRPWDTVIDYRQEDFRCTGRRYDLIVDLVGNRSLRDLRAVLRPGGLVLPRGVRLRPGTRPWTAGTAPLLAAATDLRISTPKAVPNTAVLTELGQLLSTGLIHPVLDWTFGLAGTAAIDYLETHHARAKVVITVDERD